MKKHRMFVASGLLTLVTIVIIVCILTPMPRAQRSESIGSRAPQAALESSRPVEEQPTSSSSQPTGTAEDAPSPAASTRAASGSGAEVDASYPFGAQSVWRQNISRAPVIEKSREMAQYLAATVADRYGGIAAFNAHEFNTTYYIASADTPRVDVKFNDCQSKGYLPAGLEGANGQFSSVPIPAGARPSAGTDKEMTIYLPSTDQMWEFWVAEKGPSGWSACWGGRLDDVSSGPGYFSGGFGATATGLPNAGGMVRLSDVQRGRVGHAMSLQLPGTAVPPRISWPAQRSDGIDPNPLAMPEGSRLRLNPDVDLKKLHLTRVGLLIARAAQQYGFIVSDTSGAVAVVAEEARWKESPQVDPWASVTGGPDYAVLKGFPWGELQVLPTDYGSPR